jgi:hypothetical protein
VYLELEALGLTRDIPFSLRWLVSPVVKHVSADSLETSLRQTRDAVVRCPNGPIGWHPVGRTQATRKAARGTRLSQMQMYSRARSVSFHTTPAREANLNGTPHEMILSTLETTLMKLHRGTKTRLPEKTSGRGEMPTVNAVKSTIGEE